MRIKKRYQKGFTTVDNTVLNDVNLTWKAKGLFVYLWSQSDEWEFYETEVEKHSKDGLASLKSGLGELEEGGYLKRERKRDELGRLKGSGWILSETPICDFPTLEKPTLENPILENRTLTNTNKTNINKTNTKITSTTADTEIEQLADVQAHYQTNLRPRGGIPSAVNQWLADYTKQLGPELVKFAITKGVNQASNPGPNYIKAILDSWKKKGIATVEQAENEKKARTTSKRVNRKKEVTDDGFGGFEEFL